MTIDHPLDSPVTTKHKKISYAADYFQTSSFVHCSLPAIDNYAVDEGLHFSSPSPPVYTKQANLPSSSSFCIFTVQ
jgi:hypothetical protein